MNVGKVPRYLQDIAKEFPDINLDRFSLDSTWFSYGSNLFRQDFERKMKDRGSNLSLVRARRSRLWGWTRKLDNESCTRGLAYSISNGTQDSFVDGIVHDVPVEHLHAFLQFEGVLDEDRKLMQAEGENRRRYDIKKITVQLLSTAGETTECFALVGRCAVVDESQRANRIRQNKDKLVDYVCTAVKGAIDFEIGAIPKTQSPICAVTLIFGLHIAKVRTPFSTHGAYFLSDSSM